ncbi:hypothetical protein BAUCODRAFT_507805 [Baudoinia panamericana UAMH 10762]|uniref:Uncharacterized protein n=1 Tax=Baudoinia panamericana (strain UAMH 10762) TaxID=717646 RepID=M2NAL6_BAUPA|nr:uncharacterized protein BAUCODRAFT_507805 [Baudoinia panamericana UAMH 10762]EMC95890.1 hypothetical protein BAUCODRAFT_507805 [Baudoinia panamericana UAMH 10762]
MQQRPERPIRRYSKDALNALLNHGLPVRPSYSFFGDVCDHTVVSTGLHWRFLPLWPSSHDHGFE